MNFCAQSCGEDERTAAIMAFCGTYFEFNGERFELTEQYRDEEEEQDAEAEVCVV